MRNNFSFVILFVVIAVFCNIIALFSGDSLNSLNDVGYACTGLLFSFLIIDFKINSRFSYSSLFVLVLYLFHFGQLMLHTYFSESYEHIRFLNLLSIHESLYGFRVMTVSLTALCLGCLVKAASLCNHQLAVSIYDIDWERFAKRIIYATFGVKLCLDIATLYISITAGGIAARIFVNQFPNILLFYGKISLLGFALLLVALKYHPKKQMYLFISIISYILVMMISGIRSENVGYLAIFLFIYLQSKKSSIKVSQVLLYGFFAFWGLTFIVAVGEFRSYSNKNLESFSNLTIKLLTKKNVILGLFDTCGDTGYTAHASLNNYLKKKDPSYGDAYYKGITAVVPNLFSDFIDFGKITEESSCPIKLQKSGSLSRNYENIGGSFFAEQYMNFGVFGGVIMCFLLGLFFGWVAKTSAVAFETDNLYHLIYMVPIMLASVYWVRSYFGGGIREAVWDILLGLYIFKRMR